MISVNKQSRWLMVVIVTIAAAARLTGINFGLPDLFHQDEPILINHAMAIGVGGWNPQFFVLPPFCMYFLFTIYGIGFAVLKLAGSIADTSAYATLFLSDPSGFYLAARLFLGVFFGTATVWLIGRRASVLYAWPVGLLAAFFLSLLPLHVRHSHYAYTDVAVTFALTLYWLELLRLARGEGGAAAYARAGAALGWAVSIKYTAAYVAPVFLVAWFLREGKQIASRRSWIAAFLFLSVSLLVFAVIAPYTFLDWGNFWGQIHRQAGAESRLPVLHHLAYSLIGGSNILFIAIAVLGSFALYRRHRSDALVTAFFVGVFYGVNTLFGQHYARYALPLFPALCVLAGMAWEVFFKSAGRIRFWIPAAILVLFTVNTAYSDFLFLRADTRMLCLQWFEKNVPLSARVVLDSRTYGPRLSQTAAQIHAKYDRLGSGQADAVRHKRLDFELKIAAAKKGHDLFTLSDTGESSHLFLFQEPLISTDAASVRAVMPDYLIVNHAETRPAVDRVVRELSGEIEKVALFSPYRNPTRQKSSDPYASTAAPDAPLEIFARERLGPYWEVYRFKKASGKTTG